MSRAAALALLVVACAGCRPELPLAPRTEGRCLAPIEVPYPPPAAHIQLIPPRPDEAAVWLDGSWSWTGTAYLWTDGKWTEPTPGWRFAPAKTIRVPEGHLVHCAARWHDPAAPPEAEVTPADHDDDLDARP